MRRTRKQLAADDQKLRELAGYGCTDQEIADAFGVSLSVVCRRRMDMGLPANGKHLYRRPEWNSLLTDLHSQGFSVQQIADESGLGYMTVRAWLKWSGKQVNFPAKGGYKKHSSA